MNKVSCTSTVLTCIGAMGVIATSVLTAKAVPKATMLLEDAEKKKGEDLTTIEKIKVATPAYIPAILTGASTIACIFGANALNLNHQASLMSAYALLDNSYKEYRKKAEGLYGEDADDRIVQEIAKDKYDEWFEEIEEGEQLFYDLNSMQYFTSTIDNVLQKTVTDDGLECYIISTPFDVMPHW